MGTAPVEAVPLPDERPTLMQDKMMRPTNGLTVSACRYRYVGLERPADPKPDDEWLDTRSGFVYTWTGTEWVSPLHRHES